MFLHPMLQDDHKLKSIEIKTGKNYYRHLTWGHLLGLLHSEFSSLAGAQVATAQSRPLGGFGVGWLGPWPWQRIETIPS